MRRKEFKGGVFWQILAEGWRYALQRRDLLGTYLINMNAIFFGMPNAVFPGLRRPVRRAEYRLALLRRASGSVVP
jgi:hypothetical protein